MVRDLAMTGLLVVEMKWRMNDTKGKRGLPFFAMMAPNLTPSATVRHQDFSHSDMCLAG